MSWLTPAADAGDAARRSSVVVVGVDDVNAVSLRVCGQPCPLGRRQVRELTGTPPMTIIRPCRKRLQRLQRPTRAVPRGMHVEAGASAEGRGTLGLFFAVILVFRPIWAEIGFVLHGGWMRMCGGEIHSIYPFGFAQGGCSGYAQDACEVHSTPLRFAQDACGDWV